MSPTTGPRAQIILVLSHKFGGLTLRHPQGLQRGFRCRPEAGVMTADATLNSECSSDQVRECSHTTCHNIC